MSALTSFTFGTTLDGAVAEVRPTVEAALKAEGFGVLTEIDFQAALQAKLDVDRPPLLILGVCNPPLANRAVNANPAVAALLPCSVVLREEGDRTVVEALDPLAAMELVGDPTVRAVAEDARDRLQRAIAALEASA
jgi:uncharacterized protein (DUF302 family)